jgi:tetratricopeptide (TPR) repeat protein
MRSVLNIMKIVPFKKLLTVLFSLTLMALLFGCALPQQDRKNTLSIPQSEITAISILREGLVLYRKSRFEEAELKFRQALYLAPDSTEIKANLASALRAQQLFDEALEVLEPADKNTTVSAAQNQATELDLKAQVTHDLTLASVLYASGKHQAANKIWNTELTRYLEQRQFDLAARVLQNLGAAAFIDGDESTALCAYFEKSQVKADLPTLLQLQRMLIALGKPQQAYNISLRILDQDPAILDPDFWYMLSVSALELDLQDVAVKSFGRVAAQLQSRPALSLKFAILRETLAYYYPERVSYLTEISELLERQLSAGQEKKDADPDATKPKQLESSVYQSLLGSDEALYYPDRMLEYFETRIVPSRPTEE